MFDDLTQKLKSGIQKDMQEKFGLSDEQSAQSTGILLDKIKDFFTEISNKGNLENMKQLFQDWTSTTSPLKEKFNRETLQELMDKVGLSEEVASKVKDFSVNEYINGLKESFTGLEDKLDISGILNKIKSENLEDSARDILGQFNKFFSKK
ncbi:MAG: hypothetical protein GY751_00795 [Bacteroidetes bacterium]|nr:hypothetical protein [Bacteroidota bacterium]